MASKQINLVPESVDLYLYAGDGVDIPITVADGAGAPVDLSGAVSAQIRETKLTVDPPIAVFSVNAVDAYLGKVILSLTGEQTTELLGETGRFVGVWDVQWTPSGLQPRTLCQGRVECVLDVTR